MHLSIYLGLLLISTILILFAIKNYKTTQGLLANGIRTEAKVIDFITISGEDGYTYAPLFEYKDQSNNTVTFESNVSSSPPAYDVGELVGLIYSKDGNERKIISFWGLYRWTIILLAVAAPLLIIGVAYIIYQVNLMVL